MIWHETPDTAVIVMLTQTAEAGREKCFQYFPITEEAEKFKIESLDNDKPASEGSVQLKKTDFDDASKTTVRELLMTVGEESKKVWHLLFSGWPDFDIPEHEDRAALLELLKLAAQKNRVANSPKIVHCSAGVGRSGTFIALEYMMARVDAGIVANAKQDEDMIYDVVNRLREQRMTMVQSDSQYNFLYEVVREQYQKWKLEQASGFALPAQKLQDPAKGVQIWRAQSPQNDHEIGKKHS